MKRIILLTAFLLNSACTTHTEQNLAVTANTPHPTVIAHRGASYDAPESTRAAYIMARDLGVDYLELDLQRTKDGVLIALHDDSLNRTTDVAKKFPDRKDKPVSEFTLTEIKTLDAGSWFNTAYPDRARASFAGLQILTLDEVIDIADSGGQHKPGLYIETKVPKLFPGIEKDLRNKLEARGWLNGHRVVLQTFEKSSLELLDQEMPNVPKTLLLWVGDGYMDAAPSKPFDASTDKDWASWYARQQPKDRAAFESWIDFAVLHHATAIGPSVALANGGEQSYMDLAMPWMNQMAHDKGLLVHAYTIDEAVDFERLTKAGVDGFFTNRSDALLRYIGGPVAQDKQAILSAAGF
ncbi:MULTISPECIES: glycerophosphodiester phosphodiesterase [Pseudomonas]|uniref:glycerophosphodiester phosphodiesterase n=1 Tax=Pseudomonas TaxID=286 RepID=UPI0028AEAC2D|nr:glycerophosphodiester phosphodiesterase [Pseudomonas sp.]